MGLSAIHYGKRVRLAARWKVARCYFDVDAPGGDMGQSDIHIGKLGLRSGLSNILHTYTVDMI